MRLLVMAAIIASAPAATAYSVAPGGAPANPSSLDGVWTNASYTQFERPKSLKGLVITPQEAAAYEARLSKTHGIVLPGPDTIGQEESEFADSGTRLARIRGQFRSSWIVGSVDGQVHYTEEARRRFGFGTYNPHTTFENPEGLSASDRCLFSNGSAPPQMSTMETNLLQIVQTKSEVALVAEKNHDVRVVHIGVRPPRGEPPTWSGNAYGHWEGKTLVVETQGFRDPMVDRFFFVFSGDARVVERFTRTGADEITYGFTVIDPLIFKEPVQGEMLFTRASGRPFEFACHEGNYSLPSILRAARLGRQGPPPKPATATPAPQP